MVLHPPAARHIAEVVHHPPQRIKGAVRLCAGDVHPGLAEAHNVRPAVPGGIGQEPRVFLHPPPAGHVAEVVHGKVGNLKAPVGLGTGKVDAGVAEAHDVRPAVRRRVGQYARMAAHLPAARGGPVVADQELRGPAQMGRGVAAEGEGIALHEAGDATAGSTVFAVAVGGPVPAPASAAVAAADRVLVGAAEDVSGFVGEDPVDVVRAPAVVVVVHHDPRAADRRVGEVPERVFGEKAAESPPGTKAGPQVLHVGGDAAPVGAVADGAHGRIPPQAFQVGVGRVRRRGQRDVLDVIRKADARDRVGRGEVPQAVLDLSHHLQDLSVRKPQRRRRALDDHYAHRNGSLQVTAGGRGGEGQAVGSGVRLPHRHDVGAARHVPWLTLPGTVLLRGPELLRVAQAERVQAQPLRLGEVLRRRVRRQAVPQRPAPFRHHGDPDPPVLVDRRVRIRTAPQPRKIVQDGLLADIQISRHCPLLTQAYSKDYAPQGVTGVLLPVRRFVRPVRGLPPGGVPRQAVTRGGSWLRGGTARRPQTGAPSA